MLCMDRNNAAVTDSLQTCIIEQCLKGKHSPLDGLCPPQTALRNHTGIQHCAM